MKIQVMSQSDAERYSEGRNKETSVVISITSHNDDYAKINVSEYNNILGVLNLKFDDTDISNKLSVSSNHADEVRTFVIKYKDKVDKIIVHCGAGKSRSAGLAAALLKWLYNDDTQIFNNKIYTPNMLVYRTMLNELME